MREASAVDIIHLLQSEGARIRAYDPVAMPNAHLYLHDVTLCHDAYQVAEGSDGLVVVTEWNEFKHLDLLRLRAAMRFPVIVDGRNMYDPEEMRKLGLHTAAWDVDASAGHRRGSHASAGPTASGD